MESNKNIIAALIASKSEISHALRDGTNQRFESRYATLVSVIDAIEGALLKQGIFVTQGLDHSVSTGWFLRTRLLHVSDEKIESLYPMPSDYSDPQKYGSAYTYARKYSLAAIVGISQADDDGNLASDHKPREIKNHAPVHVQKTPTTGRPSVPHNGDALKTPSISTYKIKFGKYKGQGFEEVGPRDVENYMRYLQKPSDKPMGPQAKEFIAMASEYLDGCLDQKNGPPRFDVDEPISF